MIQAQTSTEALRYSTFDVLGTGRSVGTAGAMSPLGGDFAVIMLNPAGLGTYRGSEFSISPGFFSNSSNAQLLGEGSALKDSKNKLLLSNLGLVIASRPRSAKWKTSNFAVGMTKVSDYHEKFEYTGEGTGSVTDRYRELGKGLFPDQLSGEAALAFNTGAIYSFQESDTSYYADYLGNTAANLLRRGTFESSGYNTELFFAYAANYNEKIQFGLSIGVPILSYEEQRIYREDDRNNSVDYFNSLRAEDNLSTSGSGFNFKLGLIYKLGKWVNIGLAYHSNTWYALTDNFSANLEYDYTDASNDGPIYDESPEGSFRYSLKTPSTFSGGIGAVIAKTAFISSEIQYHRFDKAKFNYSGRGNGNAFENEENAVNDAIGFDLSNALTIRTGVEVAIKKFRARLGIELDQSPYSNDSSFDPTYNAGIGFRADRFFIDLGYQRNTLEEGFLPYSVGSGYGPQPVVVRDISNNRFVLTFAYRWR